MKKILFILILSINLLGDERIVTLSPSINEIVYALGEGQNVVANTKHCDFPEESKSVPKIGGYNDISLEKILDVKPTIVIGQDYDEKLIQNLKALNIKILSYKTNTIENIKNTFDAPNINPKILSTTPNPLAEKILLTIIPAV